MLILRLIRGGIILKADSSGIKIKTLYGLKKFNWSDVNGFYVRNIHDAKMIHIEYSDSFNKMKAGSKIKSIINGGGLVFSDDFDCSAEDICSILNECKKKWETIPDNFL